MINFANFNDNNAIEDTLVGISIITMFKKEGLQAYGAKVGQGERVRCHSHTKDE